LEPFPTDECGAGKLLFLEGAQKLKELILQDGSDMNEDMPTLDALHIEALKPPSRLLQQLEYMNINGMVVV